MTGPLPINQGPCEPWCDAEQILACCATAFGTDVDLATPAEIASLILYQLSGHQYPGICEATVDACASRSCWPEWRTHDWSGHAYSTVRLAGYPIREILQVSVDGQIVDPAEYEVWYNRELVRLGGKRWPTCQRGSDDFLINYLYGLEPPIGAAGAAAQLACEIAKACPGSGLEGDCALPEGTVRITRLGLTVETQALGLWLVGSLRSGLPLVDLFLSTFGRPRGRRTALAVPEMSPWPLRLTN